MQPLLYCAMWRRFVLRKSINACASTAILLVSAVLSVQGDDYYSRFSLVAATNQLTNPIRDPELVDTNNAATRVTNLISQLRETTRSGKFSGVRMGMTMEEIVSRWGKPKSAWCRCVHGLPTFFYADLGLGFQSNRLDTVRLNSRAFGTNSMDEIIRAFGLPLSRTDSASRASFAYLSPSASLRFDFSDNELFCVWIERTPIRAEPWKQK